MNVQQSTVTQNGVFAVEMTPRAFKNTQTATVQDGRDVVVEA